MSPRICSSWWALTPCPIHPQLRSTQEKASSQTIFRGPHSKIACGDDDPKRRLTFLIDYLAYLSKRLMDTDKIAKKSCKVAHLWGGMFAPLLSCNEKRIVVHVAMSGEDCHWKWHEVLPSLWIVQFLFWCLSDFFILCPCSWRITLIATERLWENNESDLFCIGDLGQEWCFEDQNPTGCQAYSNMQLSAQNFFYKTF